MNPSVYKKLHVKCDGLDGGVDVVPDVAVADEADGGGLSQAAGQGERGHGVAGQAPRAILQLHAPGWTQTGGGRPGAQFNTVLKSKLKSIMKSVPKSIMKAL